MCMVEWRLRELSFWLQRCGRPDSTDVDQNTKQHKPGETGFVAVRRLVKPQKCWPPAPWNFALDTPLVLARSIVKVSPGVFC